MSVFDKYHADNFTIVTNGQAKSREKYRELQANAGKKKG